MDDQKYNSDDFELDDKLYFLLLQVFYWVLCKRYGRTYSGLIGYIYDLMCNNHPATVYLSFCYHFVLDPRLPVLSRWVPDAAQPGCYAFLYAGAFGWNQLFLLAVIYLSHFSIWYSLSDYKSLHRLPAKHWTLLASIQASLAFPSVLCRFLTMLRYRSPSFQESVLSVHSQ